MPFADPEQRRANSKRWREKKIAEGYGKALYARRAQRYRNEEILREAVETALYLLHNKEGDKTVVRAAKKVLRGALDDAPEVGKPIQYMPGSKGKKK